MFDFEDSYREKGYKLIAGMDEAGRGPLAGPVVCACVIMPLEDIIQGIDDSKKVSEKKREFFYHKIVEKALGYKISFIERDIIDETNILEATKRGMEICVRTLQPQPDFVLVDAVKGLNLKVPYEPIIHGDALSYNIACASILAKVARDRFMVQVLDKEYPSYNFAKHKGYATKEHIEKLKKYGKCDAHRKSFIKNFIT